MTALWILPWLAGAYVTARLFNTMTAWAWRKYDLPPPSDAARALVGFACLALWPIALPVTGVIYLIERDWSHTSWLSWIGRRL